MSLDRQLAARLADECMAGWRNRRYAQWRLMLADKQVHQVVGSDGKQYSVASYAIDDGEGRVRMVVSVDDGGWSALWPLCTDEIMRPDGSLLD